MYNQTLGGELSCYVEFTLLTINTLPLLLYSRFLTSYVIFK